MNEVLQEIWRQFVELIGSGVGLLPGLISAIVVITLTRFVANVVRNVVRRGAHRTLKSPSLRVLAVQAGHVSIWSLGIVLAATLLFPGLGVGDLIGLLGLGSVAISFAFQDIFKNFLAGILLLLQEPFRLGDQIAVGDYEGTVETIAIRSTQLRTYQGERVVVPNSELFMNVVRVFTAEPQRRTDLSIGVDYNTPLPMAVATLKGALNDIEGVLKEPIPEVDVTGFGDSSIDLKVRYWTMPDAATVRRVQSRVAIALKRECDRAGIGIPYPIRTVYFFDQDKYDDNAAIDGPRSGQESG